MGPTPQGWNFEPVKVSKKISYPFLHHFDLQKRNTPAPDLFLTPEFKNPIRRFDEHFPPEQTFSHGGFGQALPKFLGNEFEEIRNRFDSPVTPSFTTPKMNFDFGNGFNPFKTAGSFPSSSNSLPSWKHENKFDHGESHKVTGGTSETALILFIVALVITLVGCCCCYCCRACCKRKTKNSGRSRARTNQGTVLSSASSIAANVAAPSNSRGQRPQQVSTNSGVSISSKGMPSASHNMTRDTSVASHFQDDTVIIDELEHGPSAPPLTDIDYGTIGGGLGMNPHVGCRSAFHDHDPPPPYPGLPETRNDDKV